MLWLVSKTEYRGARQRCAPNAPNFGGFSTRAAPLSGDNKLLWEIIRSALLNHLFWSFSCLYALDFVHLGWGSPMLEVRFLKKLCRFFWICRKWASNRAIFMRNQSTHWRKPLSLSLLLLCVPYIIGNKGKQRFWDVCCCCWDIDLRVLLTFSFFCACTARHAGSQ